MSAILFHEVAVGPELPRVSFAIDRGESVALLADDQESVTRLVRACGGLELPHSGRITVAGLDVVTASRQQLLALRRRIGYVLAEGGAFSNMTLLENVAVVLRYHSEIDDHAIEARALALLDEIGLADKADVRASTVLPALQKRAAYARALVHEPVVLLSEDPGALLDPEGRIAVERLHRRLRDVGVTTLLADDDVDFAARLADRAIVFENGSIRYDGAFSGLPADFVARFARNGPSPS